MEMVKEMKKVLIVLAVILFLAPANGMALDTSSITSSSVTDMASSAGGVTDLLNINTASVESLTQIPGISPKIGEAISTYRELNGAFSSVSDLLNVDGIDMSLLEKIKPFLTI